MSMELLKYTAGDKLLNRVLKSPYDMEWDTHNFRYT